MANPTQQDIQQNTIAMNQLNKNFERLISSMGGRSSGYNSSSSLGNRGNNGPIDMDRLKGAVNNNSMSAQFTEYFKKLNASTKGLGDIYSELEKQTRDQSKAIRSLNKVFMDELSKSKNVVEGLEKLNDTSKKVSDAIRTFTVGLNEQKSKQTKLNELTDKHIELVAKLKKEREELLKEQKNGKKQNHLEPVMKLSQELAKLDAEIKNVTEFFEEMDKSTEIINDFAKVTGNLTDEQQEQLKNYKSINQKDEEYIAIMDTLNKSVEGFDDGVKTIANTVVDNSKKMNGAFEDFRKDLKKAAKDLLTIAPTKAFGDFMAQLKNNVNESDYKTDALMGMSETERSNIIGENRIGLRVLGNGNEAEGLKTGGKEIQRAGWQYGVTGADALKLGLQYQNNLINAGFKGSASSTADQMTVMKNFTKDLGLSDDALRDYYESLTDSGQMIALRDKYANKTEDEQRAAINKEVKQRLALNQQLGISIDMQKRLDQERTNKMFGGIAQTILGQVSAQDRWNDYIKAHPEDNTKENKAAYMKYALGQGAGMSQDEEGLAKGLNEKVAKNYYSEASKAYGSGDLGQAIQFGTKVAIQSAEGTDLGGYYDKWGKAAQRAEGLAGQKITNNKSYAEDQTNIVNNTRNGFLDLTDSMKKFNNELINGAQILHGAGQNPAGAALGSFTGHVVGGIFNYFGGKLFSKIGGKGAGWLGGKMAGKGGKIGELGSKLAGFAGSEGVEVGAKVAGKEGMEEAGKIASKTLGKSLLKKIPILGALAGLGFGAYRGFHDHDWAGAGLEATSGLLSTIPIAGTAASFGVDSYLAKRDYDTANGVSLNTSNKQLGNVLSTAAAFSTDPISTLTNLATNWSNKDGGLSNSLSFDSLKTAGMNVVDAASDPITYLEKLVKITQDQLDLQKQDQNDKQQKPAQAGDTWQMYKDHINSLRKGVGMSPV